MDDIKALLAESSANFRLVDVGQMCMPLLGDILWHFQGDAYEMINFTAAYGRDPIFNTSRICRVGINTPLYSDRSCCFTFNRESQPQCGYLCLVCDNNEFHASCRDTSEDDGTGHEFIDVQPCGHTQLRRMLMLLVCHMPEYQAGPVALTIAQLGGRLLYAWRDLQRS